MSQLDGRRPLSGRVAVVTGGGRGLGEAISIGLARAGATVCVTARAVESAEAVARRIRCEGGTAFASQCDVSKPDSVETMGEEVLRSCGRADVVVANSGIAGPTKPMQEITLEEWRECMSVDLDGVFLTFRCFIPHMVRGNGGSLIAVSSITGKRPLSGRTPYAAAKLGVIGLVRTLALELGPYGIRVNSVCPGSVAGARIESVIREQAKIRQIGEEAVRKELTEGAPLRRLVEADEVAAACVFLASGDAMAITGEDLNVAAGLVMY